MDDVSIVTLSPEGLTDKNLFAYCDNNPVVRLDNGGALWDTFFDAVSLAMSIADVIQNPSDPMAWASLVADAACFLAPGMTGGGMIVKAIGKADDVVDAAKKAYKIADKVGDVSKATGSYEIIYKSGKTYVGKGGYKRALASAKRNAVTYSDEVAAVLWKSAPNSKAAFIDEYISMCKYGGPNNRAISNGNSYNKIWSPGRKYYHDIYGSYYEYGGRSW